MAQARRGFTLTELLVVIAIIAILASLGTVAVMRAMTTARATALKTELDQIDAAMKRYKDTYGSYPPADLTNPASNARLRQHMAQAFPRYSLSRLAGDLAAAGIDTTTFRPDQALVFWLQGFSADPTTPILSVEGKQLDASSSPIGNPQKRTNNFFAFDDTRLVGVASGASTTNPAPSYFPKNARLTVNNVATKRYPEYAGGGPPVVYFDARGYELTAPVVGGSEAQPVTFNASTVLFADAGYAFPYWNDANKNEFTNLSADRDSQEGWVNPDSFQLIAAGGDNKFFSINPMPALPMDAHLFPSGKRIDVISEGDNAVNFTSSARLGDDLP